MIFCISVVLVVISPVSFLIELIWIFSLLFLVNLIMLCQFYLSFQRTSFLFHLSFVFVYAFKKDFFLKMGLHHVGQAGLELPTSGDPPFSASQSAGITDMSAQPDSPNCIYIVSLDCG